jgi:hypothetical protein
VILGARLRYALVIKRSLQTTPIALQYEGYIMQRNIAEEGFRTWARCDGKFIYLSMSF